MIRVPGTLIVNRRTGRNGAFSVGDLITAIGEFKVKDTALDQYEPGEYKGDFIIKWIEPHTNTWRGRVFVENRASLADIIITDAVEDSVTAEQKAADKTPPERDPLEEASTSSAHAPATPTKPESSETPVSEPVHQVETASRPANAGEIPGLSPEQRALLGDELSDLFDKRERIKLDPTVDREVFRKQRDLLRSSGYRFDSKGQDWYLAS